MPDRAKPSTTDRERRVDYDAVSDGYDERYRRNRWDGVEAALLEFAGAPPARILEVGCGTGHWLAWLARHGHAAVGLDRSRGMLSKARGDRACATAERLPFRDASFDRVVAVNALHHFPDPRGFFREAARVLRDAGALLSIGLDPHTGLDRWSIYDYFAPTLALDRQRYAPTGSIRASMRDAGFAAAATGVVLHAPIARPALELLDEGALDRGVTSQLLLLSEAEYAAGIAAIRADAEAARARGESLVLRSELRLYGTRASRAARGSAPAGEATPSASAR